MNAQGVRRDIVALGASAGGVQAVSGLLSLLAADFPAAVVAVIHRGRAPASRLAHVLGRRSPLPVADVADGERLCAGRVHLAPADLHLCTAGERLCLLRTPRVHFTRPAVDPLFESAAVDHGPRVVGVLLSGGGDDGVSGLLAIKAAGGLAVVQDPAEAQQPWMPVHAIAFDHVDAVLPLRGIAALLGALAAGERVEQQPDDELRSYSALGRAAPLFGGRERGAPPRRARPL